MFFRKCRVRKGFVFLCQISWSEIIRSVFLEIKGELMGMDVPCSLQKIEKLAATLHSLDSRSTGRHVYYAEDRFELSLICDSPLIHCRLKQCQKFIERAFNQAHSHGLSRVDVECELVWFMHGDIGHRSLSSFVNYRVLRPFSQLV